MFEVLDSMCKPVRGTKYSAYVDLFSAEDVTIGAGETKIVKLGVKLDLDVLYRSWYFYPEQNNRSGSWEMYLKSHYLEVALRSSLGVKGLVIANGIGIIDLDYVSHCKLNKKLNNGHCEHFKPKLNVMENKECNCSECEHWEECEIGLIVHNPVRELMGFRGVTVIQPDYFEIKKGDKVAQCTLKEHRGYLMGYESDIVRSGDMGAQAND